MNMNLEQRNVKIAVISLRAEDVPAAAHFYRDVLGLSLVGHHGHWPHFDVNGINLVILPGKPDPAPKEDEVRFPRFAFSVPDLDAVVADLKAHGVEFPWGIEASAGTRWAMFYDPAGNLIEMVTFKR